jgi:tetratricopeptide (TPR) repeat protein
MFGARKGGDDPGELLRRGEHAAAIRLLQSMLRKQPDDPRLRNLLGDAHAAAGNVRDALAAYQVVAEGYAAAGFTAKALAIWKKMSRLSPEDQGLLARISSPASPAAGAGRTGAELPETPLFPDFAPEEFAAVARMMEHRRYEAGERIVAEGEAGRSLFVIAEGSVRVTTREAGRDIELGTLRPGDFFGEVAVLKGRSRTATIEARERCEVLELSRERLDEIAARHPRVLEVMEEFNRRRAERTVEAIVESRRRGPG